jgi:hypothetical protein
MKEWNRNPLKYAVRTRIESLFFVLLQRISKKTEE